MQAGALKIVLAASTLLGAVLFIPGCIGLSSQTAASVNGTIITKDDVEARIDYLNDIYPGMVPVDDEVNFPKVRRQIMDNMVWDELERQEAERRNITVTTADVDDELQFMAEEDYLGDLQRMLEEYAKKDVTEEELRDDISRRLVHERLEAEVRKEVQVSEFDVRKYYDDNSQQYRQPERRQARLFVARSETDALAAAARVRSGESFAEVAKQSSIEPMADQNGGNLGLVSPGQLPSELDSALFKMSVGQVSDPVRVADEWNVLTVEAVEPGFEKSFEDARAEITDIIANELFAEKWKSLMDGLYSSASLEFDSEYDPKLT